MTRNAKTYGGLTALSFKSDNKWVHVTYEQYETNVKIVARAFISMGLDRHHSVGILGFNSPEWFYSNLGAIYAGGKSAGIHATIELDALLQCLNTSRANIVVVEDKKQVENILLIKPKLPFLKKIIQYKGTPPAVKDVFSWEYVMDLGKSKLDDNILSTRMNSIGVNECCTLVFTSGTEGKPKAVMLSHDNFIVNAYITIRNLPVTLGKEIIVSYLPLSHVEAQVTDIYSAIAAGAHVYFADKDASKTVTSLVNTLRDVKPTIFVGVPLVWKKLKDHLLEKGLDSVSFKKYMAGLGNIIKSMFCKKAKNGNEEEPSSDNVLEYALHGPIKTAVGFNRTKAFITTAAPMPLDVITYFNNVDINLTDIYGMSECCGAHAISSQKHIKKKVTNTGKGTKSSIFNPDKNRIGELCIYGNHVFMGYLDLPLETTKTIDLNGWLHTGDWAQKSQNGFVTITGRKKELIITAEGEKVPPAYIEKNVKAELPFIRDAFLVGDNRPFLSILLSLKCNVNSDLAPTDDLAPKVIEWLISFGSQLTKVSEVIKNTPAQVTEAIKEGIENANKKALSNEHKIQKFEIIPTDFSEPTDELGSKFKNKRSRVNETNKELIEKLYRQ